MKLKLTHIKWFDASGTTEGGWQMIEDVMPLEMAEVETCGFILKETEEYVLLVNSHSDGDASIGGFVIPKVNIRSRKDY